MFLIGCGVFLDNSGRLWHKLLCKGLPNNPNSEASSQPMEVWRSDDRYLPHVKATILVNTSVKSGEFLRAEILSVLRLIIHQMRQKRLSPHMIVPVPLYPIPLCWRSTRLNYLAGTGRINRWGACSLDRSLL